MRIGAVLPSRTEAQTARSAEDHALAAVIAGDADPVTAINAAVYASLATCAVRIVVRVGLGGEHPVTLAEEVAVLDNINGGRSVVLADIGALGEDMACEEIELLCEALSARPVSLERARFNTSEAGDPHAISVTPEPAQIEIPVWVSGEAATSVSDRLRLPRLAVDNAPETPSGLLQPALLNATGNVRQDRDAVRRWQAWGASHVFLRVPDSEEYDAYISQVGRVIAPEVATPDFPPVMAEAQEPLRWPGKGDPT